MKIYLVGGAVRDELLGYPTNEYDYVVVSATPELMVAQGFTPVGKDFPVFLHPDTRDEYALARTERKSGRGYKGFSVNASPDITLEQDLIRRDLTINAIAKSDQGQLIDPYGGIQDIKQKVLRHVSDAFREDPVRILRVARFAARYHHLGFTIAPETILLMRKMVRDGETNYLVAERIWKELSRALSEPSPHIFIDTLQSCGALASVMPELHDAFCQHEKTALTPIDKLRAAAALTQNTKIRLSILLYDLARQAPNTLDLLSERVCMPNAYKELCDIVIRFSYLYEKLARLTAEDIVQALKKVDVLRRPERYHEYLDCCEIHDRITHDETEFSNSRQILESAAHAMQSVESEQFVKSGFKGKALGDKINEARINSVARSLEAHQR